MHTCDLLGEACETETLGTEGAGETEVGGRNDSRSSTGCSENSSRRVDGLLLPDRDSTSLSPVRTLVPSSPRSYLIEFSFPAAEASTLSWSILLRFSSENLLEARLSSALLLCGIHLFASYLEEVEECQVTFQSVLNMDNSIKTIRYPNENHTSHG